RLRPYAAPPTMAAPRQLGAREALRLLDIRLIERVDPQTLAQRHGRILPPEELGAEVERIGGEHVRTGSLRVGQGGRSVWFLHDRNDAAAILAGALGDELLDPVGQRGDSWWRNHAQLVPSGLCVLGNRGAHRLRGAHVNAT